MPPVAAATQVRASAVTSEVLNAVWPVCKHLVTVSHLEREGLLSRSARLPQRSCWRTFPTTWIGLAVIALPCVLYSMDLINLAVPALSRDMQPSSTQLLWIIDIYGFLVAGSLITMYP
jgi:hypothetical protein